MARLSKEQRAELEKQLADDDAAAEADEDEYEYEIGRGDNYARVSSKSKAGRKIAKFFKDSFDIDLDEEPVQDDAEAEEGKPGKKAPAGPKSAEDNVRAFGRRVR